MTYEEILQFWFVETRPEQWWRKDGAFDLLISSRFRDIHTQAARCELFAWRETPRGRLAEVIVLDQFSRNLFRDSGLAFANDALALGLAQEAVHSGADQALTALERSFLYMPWMHSESLLIHDQAVALFTRNGIASNLDFENKHRDIIVQFGRYPHRNRLLGRSSTPEELEFLTRHSGF